MKKITVNMASESDISVQGHGVHTAYEELLSALEKRNDISVIRGGFRRKVSCDIYHLHTIGLYMWRKILDRSAKKVVSAHVIPDSFIGSIVLARYWRFAARWYMQWFYNRADVVLAVSQTVASVLRHELRVPSEKIKVLYNTIDMSQYKTTAADRQAARKQLHIAKDKFVVVGVGQVQPRKRLDVFEAMARRLPDVEFIWVGGIPFGQLGADYKSMQQLIERVPKNLTITDTLPHEKVKKYLQAADVFCLPAEQENHPMCVLEAAGVGLPIIVRDIREYNDTFANDVMRCTTEDDFTNAVIRLRTDKKAYRQQKLHTAVIAKRFDSKVAARQLADIYKELVQPKKGA